MVEQTVEHGGDGGGIAEQRVPVLDGTVRREDGAGPLIAAHDDLEQVLSGVGRELAHAEIVDDEQGHRGEFVHVLFAPFVEDGVQERVDQHVRLPIEHAGAWPNRRAPEGLHEMALAGAGGPQQQDVLAVADEARRGEFQDERAWDLGVEAEVEAVEGAVRITEASGLDASREEPILASDELIADQGRHGVDRGSARCRSRERRTTR